MKATLSKSAIARAGAAAALAALLAACGKSVTVTGGGGEAALPTEERLFAAPAHVARAELPNWVRLNANFAPTAVNRATPGVAAYTDLLSVAERAAIPTASLSYAARHRRPSFAFDGTTYTRPPPYTRLSPSQGAFWREDARDRDLDPPDPEDLPKEKVLYWAASGVSQSSRGRSSRSGDRVHAEVGWRGDRPTFRVGLRYASDPEEAGSLTDWLLGSDGHDYFTRWTGPDGTHGGVFHESLPGGNLKLIVRTDRTGAADTDWLATGMWWSSTENAPRESFGVFADGGDPVHVQTRARQLAGTATYTGGAHGVFSYRDAGNDRNVPFQARATLAADFGDASAFGSVSGRIHDMRAGRVSLPGLPAITLREGSINGSDWERTGTFRGFTAMEYAEQSWRGQWGGQFFGNAAAGATGADAHPSSAAGTFGASAGEGRSFIGTFEVHRGVPPPIGAGPAPG